MDPKELIRLAGEAQQQSYSPYSKYPVGAALLTESGKVYTGCNVEVSSYGLTCCAERVAIFKAVSEGERQFKAIAVVALGKQVCICGACRQVIWEFAPDLTIYGENSGGQLVTKHIRDLLPGAFDKSILLDEKPEASS